MKGADFIAIIILAAIVIAVCAYLLHWPVPPVNQGHLFCPHGLWR